MNIATECVMRSYFQGRKVAEAKRNDKQDYPCCSPYLTYQCPWCSVASSEGSKIPFTGCWLAVIVNDSLKRQFELGRVQQTAVLVTEHFEPTALMVDSDVACVHVMLDCI